MERPPLGTVLSLALELGERPLALAALDLVARRLDDRVEAVQAAASSCVRLTKRSIRSLAAPDSTASAATLTPAPMLSALPAAYTAAPAFTSVSEQGRAGVSAREHVAGDAGVLVRGAESDRVDRRALDAEILRSDRVRLHLSVPQLDNACGR